MDARAWDERYAAADLVWSRGPNALVEETIGGLPPGRAVDLACGEGRNALWLAARGWTVTAVDFSAVAVERGTRLASELPADAGAITWVVGDVLAEPLPQADLALLAYLQLPAAQRRRVVRRAAAALMPGGTLLVVAHDSTNLADGTGGPQDPAVLYTAEDVLADLALEDPVSAAYDVLRAERVARVVTADDGHGGTVQRTAWDAVVHLRRR